MVKFCFRYEIYGYEIYGRRYEIYGSLRDLWEGLRDLWEFARFMGVTRFMGRTLGTTLKIRIYFICRYSVGYSKNPKDYTYKGNQENDLYSLSYPIRSRGVVGLPMDRYVPPVNVWRTPVLPVNFTRNTR